MSRISDIMVDRSWSPSFLTAFDVSLSSASLACSVSLDTLAETLLVRKLLLPWMVCHRSVCCIAVSSSTSIPVESLVHGARTCQDRLHAYVYRLDISEVKHVSHGIPSFLEDLPIDIPCMRYTNLWWIYPPHDAVLFPTWWIPTIGSDLGAQICYSLCLYYLRYVSSDLSTLIAPHVCSLRFYKALPDDVWWACVVQNLLADAITFARLMLTLIRRICKTQCFLMLLF